MWLCTSHHYKVDLFSHTSNLSWLCDDQIRPSVVAWLPNVLGHPVPTELWMTTTTTKVTLSKTGRRTTQLIPEFQNHEQVNDCCFKPIIVGTIRYVSIITKISRNMLIVQLVYLCYVKANQSFVNTFNGMVLLDFLPNLWGRCCFSLRQ